MAAAPGLAKYPHVFEPLKLGPVELKNRIYMPPHGNPFQVGVPGTAHIMPAAEAAFYYRERARGGVSLIFYSTAVTPVIGGVHPAPSTPASVDSFARFAEIVQEAGAKMIAEVQHGGSSVAQWEPIGPTAPALGSSLAQNFNAPIVRRGMKADEIKRLVECYVVATRNLRKAGWDGVEVHASHGVLMEHFLSTYFNRREDEYGGDLAGRCRMLVETLQAVRSETGPGMAVGIRINADELIPGGIDAAGTREILEYLAPMGLLDFVDLDVSVEPEQAHLMTTTFFEPKHHNLPHVTAVAPAAKSSMVVIATPGRVTSLSEAEAILASGVVDMVGIGRGHIAEPELVNNGLEGREKRGRRCIAANHCLDSRLTGLGCAINPATGREERWGVRATEAAPSTQRVVVVGGGPGGCEAARVAALRGHTVTLFERRPTLGGGLSLWARLPGREHLVGLMDWYASELDELGVDVRLGADATVGAVTAEQPDVAILATGSRFSQGGESGFKQTAIPGSDQDFVYVPEDLLEDGGVELSGKVVVLDEEGRHAAGGIAVLVAQSGGDVDYVTRFPFAARAMLINAHGRYIVAQMRQAGVRLNMSTYITEIGDHQVTLLDTMLNQSRTIDVDAVILATMRAPETELADALEGQVPYVYVIGDAASPRTLHEATYEGQRFARVIGEPDMPESVTADLFAAGAAPLRAATLA